MDPILKHIDQSARDGLRPEFASRVMASVGAEQRVRSEVWRSPPIAVAIALALCTAAVLTYDRVPRTHDLPAASAWTDIHAAALSIRPHL
jgi:hypothetical protein